MKCMYFLSPTLKSCKEITDDLHSVGVKDYYLHVVSKDEAGLNQKHIHSSNYFETLDLIRSTTVGGLLGFLISICVVILTATFDTFGSNPPGFVYVLVVVLITLFGIWEGGLYGIDTENQKIAPYHEDIESGKYLILIYASRHQSDVISKMMKETHPESELVGVDRHYTNPFSKVREINHHTKASV